MILNGEKDDRQGRVPYEYIRDIFSQEDASSMSIQCGIPYDEKEKCFTIKMMAREYKVFHPEGKIIDIQLGDEIKAYAIKTLVLRYLVHGKGVPAFNRDITYKEIHGGLVYYRNFYNRTILKLAKIFSNDLKALEEGALFIGGEILKKGDASCRFQFINNVYITFIVWQGDDELPASANILFDENIEYYFNAEDLAVVGDVAIELLKNKGKIPNWIGLYQKKTEKGYEIN